MPFNLIDAAKSMIPHDLIAKEATALGENESNIRKAFTGAIPSVLAALLEQNSGAGAAGILEMVKQVMDAGTLNEGNNIRADNPALVANSWLHSLFGDKLEKLFDSIGGFAGIKPSSAQRVLGLATPAALAALGRYARDMTLNAAGLSSYLHSQKAAIFGSVPSGLDLAAVLGFSTFSDITEGPGSPPLSPAALYPAEAANQRNPWPWLLVLLVAVVFIWVLVSGSCNA
jgi:hypothetical protein